MTDVRTRVVEPFVDAVTDVAPGATVMLYGSLARGNFVEGLSDLNLLVVAPTLDGAVLERLGPALTRWREAGYPPPLLFPAGEWDRAIDVFQVELADMRTAYQVLQGSDPLASHAPEPGVLRLALEREFRGKLMRLRQGYAQLGDDPKALGRFAIQSASTALVLLRALLGLHRDTVPASPAELVRAAESRIGSSLAAITEVAQRRSTAPWACPRDTFLDYLSAVEVAAAHVDRFDPLAGDPR